VVDVKAQVRYEFGNHVDLEVAKGDLEPIDERDSQNLEIRLRERSLCNVSNNLVEITKLIPNTSPFQE